MVVLIGADVHKNSHTFVAVDAAGKQIGQITVRATHSGHEKAYRWAKKSFIDQDRRWGVEDCRHLTGLVERDLLAHGEPVLRVPTKLMARQRAAVRTRGKSDPIDALSVARAMAREEDLPIAFTDEPAREIKLVLARREDLVAERTRVINRLRWHVHELDPELDPAPRALIHRPAQARVWAVIEASDGIVAEIAGMVLADLQRLCLAIRQLDTRLRVMVSQVEPVLLDIPGCAQLSAAKIIAESAGIKRFSTESKFAMYAGCAPIPVWSGKTEGRVRLNRGGNRQLNCAIHRIAITQVRLQGPGKEYYERLRGQGKTVMEALRCVKNAIARRIWRALTRAHAQAIRDTPITLKPTLTTCIPQAA
ncbi:IS110 family transposase [Kocuria sp.]|uniref:IS110 family transposase n=1 Tax=Kocuria sp. TaxID=1871328 RepID=UPI0026DF177E|nr:IS110 family transposase [Kocuria sp.]MDO5619157.1 IS110 family transposase [Kocuria sp.]